jgi:hypothetical protein
MKKDRFGFEGCEGAAFIIPPRKELGLNQVKV